MPTLILSSQFMINICRPLLSTVSTNVEIKPQAKISPQFGLFNSEKPSVSRGLRPPNPLLYFLGPAINKHSVTPLLTVYTMNCSIIGT